MFLEYIVDNFLLIYLMELGAAIAGSIYLWKARVPQKGVRLFVYYLWLVVFVELIGLYPSYAYFNDYNKLGFIKDTLFERNYWWYNSYSVIKFLVLYVFFILQLNPPSRRRKLFVISALFILSFIIHLIFGDTFFKAHSAYMSVTGTLFLMILILLYHFEILKSDRILKFYRSMPFYISIGILIWHVSITPVFIYNKYFTLKSPDFIYFQMMFLRSINIFLYGILILGFIVCTFKRNKLSGSK
ncbi:hypothetical protein FK178_01375 [Antarcticibacterium arcticum]|uniref:Uncharacterized protein n=1 Tax=Antarcticibacterium arcticum TaxID=2585771 RepID=A0A5B8YFV3_9FLAO|nr:hypothetical protein [Antarcticibacterium arcticum]QED36451.1 hypothetical protein FK178_01375 [Antarcticibacterium arcticum]